MLDRRVINHIIFDLDGTLVDSNATCVEILSAMLAERGSDRVIDPQWARSYMSRGGLDMVSALLGEACGDPNAELLEFRARYHRHETSVDTLYPGVIDNLLRLAAGGFSFSICSNKPQALCEKVLSDTGLAHQFPIVVGGQHGLRPKPASDLLDAVIARLEHDIAHCVFVGDSELDHTVALNAGLPFHFMTHGYAEPGWQAVGCAVHHSFADLADALLGPPQRYA